MKSWRSLALAIVLYLITPLKLVRSENTRSLYLANNSSSCPEDLQQLTSSLLKDLPNYSNRVINRTQRTNRKAGIKNFIITASQAEFQPLDLPQIQYNPISDRQPEQVFFTVLERQYQNNRVKNIQTYHWLFLTQTEYGWQTVMMFSRFGNSQGTTFPAPPRETTNGIIGQGVQLWLKDCRAGIVEL